MNNIFPNLNHTNHVPTSPETYYYNCIAWAAEENDRWWWPQPPGVYYWPKGVSRSLVPQSFIDAFRGLGYEECESGEVELGYQKVVIYTKDGVPTHMARQLHDGAWTSKLGRLIDITHYTVDAVEGPCYGIATVYMRRPIV